MMRYLRRTAPGVLAILAIAGCGATELSSPSADRITPTLTIGLQGAVGAKGDSASLRSPLTVTVQANDNATLSSVVTVIFADTTVIVRDSAVVSPPSTSFSKQINVPVASVRSGQRITVVVTARDGSGNEISAQTSVTAFDPSIPVVELLNPQPTVIQGGTYTFDILVRDSLGVAKVGYRSVGSGALTKADSVLLQVQAKIDTVQFSVTVPASAAVNSEFVITPFAENRDALRGTGSPVRVRVIAPGADLIAPLVYQTVPARMETGDSLEIIARDPDGIVRIVGFIARNEAGVELYRSADTLGTPSQQVTRRKQFAPPIALRGRNLFITAYAIDISGRTGYGVPNGATVPATDAAIAKRDLTVYAYGLTSYLPEGSLGADIAVDTSRSTVYVSNINRNQLEAYTYASSLQQLTAVAVGAQPWGMTIDNSGSLLLVANSGGTNVSKVNLLSRAEEGRVKTANEYIFDVTYSIDAATGGFRYKVAPPIDYSDRPQYIAQSASGALYYSTKPTNTATPGTLRRLDNFLDARAEPRQIWQYGKFKKNQYVIINADAVDVIEGGEDAPDQIIICEHTPGQSPTTAVCVSSTTIPGAVAQLRASPVNGNVEAVKDLDVASLSLPDTNFVAVGGDRRRVAFGEGNTGGRAGRVLLVYDPSGTPANGADYSAPLEVADLTNNASDQVFGLAINNNSSNIGVHGVETFFADSSLRLQGKYATFNSGAGIAFHPLNSDENTADTTARVVFVASGDQSIQIVDSYSYRIRGRIPLRANLYGPLRAVLPTTTERNADPSLVVKLFGLTPEGLVLIDVRTGDIDNSGTRP